MEDVWEGININLTSLSDHTNTNTSKGAKFQDFLFLARPNFTNFSNTIASDPSPPPPPPPPPPPATALTLNTRSELHFDLQLGQPHNKKGSKLEPFGNPFGYKRTLSSGDMRKARLMKNRESAARSRARKQVYLSELKQKIKQLREENARLRKQQQLLCENAANEGKRGNLYRTYTAPF